MGFVFENLKSQKYLVENKTEQFLTHLSAKKQ